MKHSITRLSELLAQPDAPAPDVVANALKGYLTDMAATYGKPGRTWANDALPRLAMAVAAEVTERETAFIVRALAEMDAGAGACPFSLDFSLGDELRDAAARRAGEYECRIEGAA